MTIYFGASEPESFSWTSTIGVTAATSSAQVDTKYSRAGINIASSAVGTATFTAQTNFWMHLCYGTDFTNNVSINMVQLIDTGSSSSRVQLENTGSGFIRLGYWNGSSFTYLPNSTGFAISANTRYDIDIQVNINSSGSISFYVNNNLIGSFSGNTTSVGTSFGSFSIAGSATSNDSTTFSQMIISDQNSLGMKLATLNLTGSGATSNWTGTVSLINGNSLNDANFISDNTNGDISTFTAASLPSGGTWNVIAVVQGMRAENAVSGIQNLQFALRSGSTNYFSSNVSGLTTTFGPFQQVWMTDPNTSSTWSTSSVNSIQPGVKAIT